MRVILVDDEPHFLADLEKRLKDFDGIELIGMYSNPRRAKEAILREKPDAVFLKIEMPEVTGIEIAEKILKRLPSTNIIFMADNGVHAVKAFELNAVDYLLKPLNGNRLSQTVRRVQNQHFSGKLPVYFPMISCFRTLQFLDATSQKIHVRWRTAKARDIFLFLLQNRQHPVSKDMILELFWPDVESEKAYTQLYTAIYQIRKTLQSIQFPITITSEQDDYLLDLNGVRLDVDDWERGIRQYENVTEENVAEQQRLINLYQGDYLNDVEYIWAEGERERLRTLWFSHVTKLADYYIAKEEYVEAVSLYTRIQELQPFIEDSYFILMQLYDELSDRYHVELQYEKLQKMLADQFFIKPNRTVRNWYKRWKEKAR